MSFNILDLPEELIILVFGELGVPERLVAGTVCKDFHRIATDIALWRRKVFPVPLAETVPPPSRVCSSSIVYGNKIYVFGGHDPLPGSNYIRDVKNDLYEYTIDTNSWKKIENAEFPARTEHPCCLWQDHLYIVGGYSDMAGYIMDVSRISLETFSYKQMVILGESPSPRSAHTAVVYKKQIYVFGGWDGEETTDHFHKYHLKKKTWSRVKCKGPRPSPRRSHVSFMKGDSLYIWGGFDGSNNCSPLLHRYDFETKRWHTEVTFGTPPSPRSRSQCVVYHNKFAVFGGWDRKEHFGDWHEYNFDTHVWKQVPVKFPIKALGQHTAQRYQNSVYVFAGFNAESSSSCNLLWCHSLGHLGLQNAG